MKIYPFLIVGALALCVAACKPTETNYKAAYDVAQAKRASEAAEHPEGIVREGDPEWRKIGNDSLLVKQQPLARLDGDTAKIYPVNVAIASYRMRANAVAHADGLRSQGLNSRVLQNRDEYYYVIAAQYDSIQPALTFIPEYMKNHPDDMYAGLPGRPVVEIPAGVRVKF